MISVKILQSALKDLGKITNSEFALFDSNLELILISTDKNREKYLQNVEYISHFIESSASSQEIGGINYFRIEKEGAVYTLVVNPKGGDGYTYGRIALSEISHFMKSGSEKMELEDFYKDIIEGRIVHTNVLPEAKRFKLESDANRVIYYIKTDEKYILPTRELLSNMFAENKQDYVLGNDSESILLIKTFEENDENIYEYAEDIANQIVSMINTELMATTKVAYSSVKNHISLLNEAYREASAAMEIADVFFEDKKILCYSLLGIGRIIKEMPKELAIVFLKEIFGEKFENSLTKDEKKVADIFMDNNLSIADASRKMNVPRSTLVYKIDKLKKKTGLDIRHFNDAMTLKIALMVAKYHKCINE